MSFVDPLALEEIDDADTLFDVAKKTLGFVPNAMLIMAKDPKMTAAFQAFVAEVLKPGKVQPDLKIMAANLVSYSSGCRYCMAHTGNIIKNMGVSNEKIEALWEYETSPLFDDAERSALKFAQTAAVTPGVVTKDDFDEIRQYFDDDQIVEIVAVISLYTFFNRWNDTFATELEDAPKSFAETHLAKSGWEAGKHAK